MRKLIVFSIALIFMALSGDVYAHHHNRNAASMSVSERRADSIMQLEMAEHQQMEAVQAFPNYHPLIVHFPIVLLLMAAIFQLLSFFFFKKEFGWTTLILLALAVITTWLASNTFHADPGELKGKAAEIFKVHEQMASYTWWFSLAALITKLASHFFLKRKWWIESATALLLVGAGITVSIAGHHGAMLVYMQGIGPEGKYLDSYRLPLTNPDSGSTQSATAQPDGEEHPVGVIGKGPHRGTIEEADPGHIEIVADGNDLVFYLLDGETNPLDMKNVTGSVKMQYADHSIKTIDLMEMDDKLTAMAAINGKAFTALCTLSKDGKSYSASFNSNKDLLSQK